MSTYKISVEIQGASPILMNRFTDGNAAQVSAGTSSAIKVNEKGTPRQQAEPKLYLTGDGKPMIPGPNVFSGITAAGKFHKAGRKQITTGRSSLVPAGVQVEELECLLVDPFKPDAQIQWEVDSRSVVIPSTGGRIMCHRPRFDAWKLPFTLIVDGKMFDEALVRALVDDFGSKIGLGDWRPDRKGPMGRFNVTKWQREVAVTDKDAKKSKAA